MSDVEVPFEKWCEMDFRTISDREYCLKIQNMRNKFEIYSDDDRFKEVPHPKPEHSPQTVNEFFYIVFKSHGGEILGLYHKTDLYLFASKPIRVHGAAVALPFERVDGVRFELPYPETRLVPGLDVSYKSLLGGRGGRIPSFTLMDMSNAVTTLARGSSNNENWGPALANLVCATSEAIRSIGMERHVSFGLNIKSEVPHVPSNRLVRINHSWSKISKSIRSKEFDFVLKYENKNGVRIEEAITQHSVGLILAVINYKDGSKKEKMARKLEKKAHKKRDDDQAYGGRRETGSEKGFKGQKGNKKPQSSGGKYQTSAYRSAADEPKACDYPEPFPVRMFPCKTYFSDDSSSDYSSSSDSECETNVSVDELVKEKIEEKITTCEEASEELLSDGKNIGQSKINKENSSNQLSIVPASSILVKHGGMKSAAEAGVISDLDAAMELD